VELDHLDAHRRAGNAGVHVALGGAGRAEHLVEAGFWKNGRGRRRGSAAPAGAAGPRRTRATCRGSR
jgi:hypothetical protein